MHEVTKDNHARKELVSKPGTKAQGKGVLWLRRKRGWNCHRRWSCCLPCLLKESHGKEQEHLQPVFLSASKIYAQLKNNTQRAEQTPTTSSSTHQPTLTESIDKSQKYDKKGWSYMLTFLSSNLWLEVGLCEITNDNIRPVIQLIRGRYRAAQYNQPKPKEMALSFH